MVNLFKSQSGQWYIYKIDEGWTVLGGFSTNKSTRVDTLNVLLHSEISDVSVFDLLVKNVSDLLNCYQYEPGQACKNLVTGELEFEAECSSEWLEKSIMWIDL